MRTCFQVCVCMYAGGQVKEIEEEANSNMIQITYCCGRTPNISNEFISTDVAVIGRLNRSPRPSNMATKANGKNIKNKMDGPCSTWKHSTA